VVVREQRGLEVSQVAETWSTATPRSRLLFRAMTFDVRLVSKVVTLTANAQCIRLLLRVAVAVAVFCFFVTHPPFRPSPRCSLPQSRCYT
jgi:hypothetical protein